jgi:hypothetical protein
MMQPTTPWSINCRNPSFGLATKARGYKVAGVKRKEARESRAKKPGSQEERSPGVKRNEARESRGTKPGSKGKGIGRVQAKRKPGSHHILPGV